MSKYRIRGKGNMPDQWEWSCDECGKVVHTSSNNTRPPGWVPKGKTVGNVPDFCSPEHEQQHNAKLAAAKESEGSEAKAEAESTPKASTEPATEA